ncbi:MAG: hypothetical protein LAT55_02280 [Opitutales bacterium]|nr:hypothetical protein [Opitutales bacterium]
MRTTLDIDADVLAAAKELAAQEKTTTGRILTRLARRGLSPEPGPTPRVRNGIEMLPRRGEPITLDHVQSIMDKEGI